MTRFSCHLFVCTNRRAEDNPKGCCASKGSEQIAKAIKIKAYERGLKGQVRVNQAGCIDACATGVSAVMYPSGVYYQQITLDDVDEIVERSLVQGEVIKRLVLPFRQAAPPAGQETG